MFTFSQNLRAKFKFFFSNEKKIDDKNENDLNSLNQSQDEIKEKPTLKKFESFDERKAQDILTQPREEVSKPKFFNILIKK